MRVCNSFIIYDDSLTAVAIAKTNNTIYLCIDNYCSILSIIDNYLAIAIDQLAIYVYTHIYVSILIAA